MRWIVEIAEFGDDAGLVGYADKVACKVVVVFDRVAGRIDDLCNSSAQVADDRDGVAGRVTDAVIAESDDVPFSSVMDSNPVSSL